MSHHKNHGRTKPASPSSSTSNDASHEGQVRGGQNSAQGQDRDSSGQFAGKHSDQSNQSSSQNQFSQSQSGRSSSGNSSNSHGQQSSDSSPDNLSGPASAQSRRSQSGTSDSQRSSASSQSQNSGGQSSDRSSNSQDSSESSSISQTLSDAKSRLGDMAESGMDQISEAWGTASGQGQQALSSIQSQIRQNPIPALSAAFGLGILTAMLIHRD